jgi:hypothetical protein
MMRLNLNYQFVAKWDLWMDGLKWGGDLKALPPPLKTI